MSVTSFGGTVNVFSISRIGTTVWSTSSCSRRIAANCTYPPTQPMKEMLSSRVLRVFIAIPFLYSSSDSASLPNCPRASPRHLQASTEEILPAFSCSSATIFNLPKSAESMASNTKLSALVHTISDFTCLSQAMNEPSNKNTRNTTSKWFR